MSHMSLRHGRMGVSAAHPSRPPAAAASDAQLLELHQAEGCTSCVFAKDVLRVHEMSGVSVLKSAGFVGVLVIL